MCPIFAFRAASYHMYDTDYVCDIVQHASKHNVTKNHSHVGNKNTNRESLQQ